MAAAQIEPGYCLAGAQTALQLLQQQRACISLSASSLDSMLQGGVQLGNVTEFYGVPGVGKTQVGIQLAVNVQVRPASQVVARMPRMMSTDVCALPGTATASALYALMLTSASRCSGRLCQKQCCITLACSHQPDVLPRALQDASMSRRCLLQ